MLSVVSATSRAPASVCTAGASSRVKARSNRRSVCSSGKRSISIIPFAIEIVPPGVSGNAGDSQFDSSSCHPVRRGRSDLLPFLPFLISLVRVGFPPALVELYPARFNSYDQDDQSRSKGVRRNHGKRTDGKAKSAFSPGANLMPIRPDPALSPGRSAKSTFVVGVYSPDYSLPTHAHRQAGLYYLLQGR